MQLLRFVMEYMAKIIVEDIYILSLVIHISWLHFFIFHRLSLGNCMLDLKWMSGAVV